MSYAVADQQQYTLRICEARCTTCIFHAGNRAHLAPGRLASLIKEALEAEGHIVCHATLDTDEPAICRGYANLPQAADPGAGGRPRA
ncbi:hypothetical protein ABZ630_24915 [Streptomyces albidoflavus]|uniref:hypothetical protein n=1 Tax=Streptomyces albidoflavus TaxID=1886 RepID=UPI0033E2F600